jgi:hypothetical protein
VVFRELATGTVIVFLRCLSGVIQWVLSLILAAAAVICLIWYFVLLFAMFNWTAQFRLSFSSVALLILAIFLPWLVLVPVIFFGFKLAVLLNKAAKTLRP